VTGRLGIAAAVLVVVVVIVIQVIGRSPDRSRSQSPARVPSGAGAAASDERDGVGAGAGPGPHRVVDGIGVGFARDEQGAVAAAMSYASAPQAWLYQADEQVTSTANAIVVPAARDGIVPDIVEEARVLRNEVSKSPGVVWFVVAPLATRVESYDEDRATVRVWVVRVLSAEAVAAPQSGWTTLTLGLAWDRDDWRIRSVDEVEGPVPQVEAGQQPWAPEYLAAKLSGFERVGAA
jgi:hypothetical protein